MSKTPQFTAIDGRLMMAWWIFYFASLVTLGEGTKAHYRIKHNKNEFANGRNYINDIENFWSFAKFRLTKFKGIKKENFVFHLKEIEFRYNTKNFRYNTKILGQNLYQNLLKLIRKNPIKF